MDCGPMRQVKEIRKAAIERLAQAGIDPAALDVDLLLQRALGLTALEIMTAPDRPVPAPMAAVFARLLDRRFAREPMSQILGERGFWSLDFKVSRDCLTPRPDSETLIEAALNAVPDRTRRLRILDLGTGSGCLILSLLAEFPRARGVAVDISQPALALARENAGTLGFADRCDFRLSDWDSALGAAEKFDIILCNPPYIDPGERQGLSVDVRDYEPEIALFAADGGLAEYRRLAGILPRRMAPGGHVFLEIGHTQGAAVTAIMAATGARNCRISADLAGRDRCVILDF